MSPQIIGAGLGRTGTASLKQALELLLGKPCYHMIEVFQHPEHIKAWHDAARGNYTECIEVIGNYGASVDWPASAFWRELSDAYPDALILLSVRDTEEWWESASQTIFKGAMDGRWDRADEWAAMIREVLTSRFTDELKDPEACKRAFERHNEEVRRYATPGRLLVWQASDGWDPICKALGMSTPDLPFPRTNTKEEFIARIANGPPLHAPNH